MKPMTWAMAFLRVIMSNMPSNTTAWLTAMVLRVVCAESCTIGSAT